jgi:hypothetical protein
LNRRAIGESRQRHFYQREGNKESEVIQGLICWLHNWQELLGGVFGGLVGAVMGFWGANVVAKDVRKTERNAAVRVVLMDLFAFKAFADDLAQRAEDQPANKSALWLTAELERYYYPLSPMLDHHMPQLLGANDPKLSADLMAFSTHYREVRVRLSQSKLALTSPSIPEIQKAFKLAREAANRAVDKMAEEYFHMYGVLKI